ncbi:branched-chain amino acid aminotransferase 5 / branched-chain amino acid transaminase 5 (BCAT5);little nuclei4 [Tasmannia lanceolata]|uniref:branched-chain amino acid aminotransferase 5 / branched-chain amino acid transaminase 5 (BCAT5);little nuclei4 n=1 Tax=Tasmannia lanceolata TaxID=3420 RepID=UPI004063A037
MVSPQQKELVITPASNNPIGSPFSRVLEAPDSNKPIRSSLSRVLINEGSPLSDETIWNRLREVGFDEDSIKRRDKAALIAYIAKLESEIYNYQHHMGLLILERKEWTSKHEQVKLSVDSAEAAHRRDQAAHISALAEAKKQEESLKRALAIEKECLANIEKTLHAMRAESAETKLASESKLAEARIAEENAQAKFIEAKTKLHAAESLQAEASRSRFATERMLQEVEAREDELRRRLISLKSEYDAKEKEIGIERQFLCERQKTLQQGQEKLFEGQALLNQREEGIFRRSQELSQLEREFETAKATIEKEFRVLKEEKSNMDLKMDELATREEAIIKMESLQAKKEKDFLILQEKLASKEHEEIQKLKAGHEAALETRKIEFEAELERERKLVEDEIEAKRQTCKVREDNLTHIEEQLKQKTHYFELQASSLVGKENSVAQKLRSLEEKEQIVNAGEKAAEIENMRLQKEREEIANLKVDIQKCKDSLENEKKQVIQAQKKLEITKRERRELLSLQTKLKEEIDSFRTQKLEVMSEADDLKTEKEKFESEWQIIDEKREELRKEVEKITKERNALCKFLKEEQDSLRSEKDALRDKFKHDYDTLSCEREAFISKMEHERSEWLSKIEQERADFIRDIEFQKSELENSINKRREEIENNFKEREEEFEREKAKELQYINSQKEMIVKELEHVASEMKRLGHERVQITLDRERREKEWSEIKSSVEELQIQTQKLQKQRELLHTDREEIHIKIQHLKELEDLKIPSESMSLSEMKPLDVSSNRCKVPSQNYFNAQPIVQGMRQDLSISKETVVGYLGPGCLSMKASESVSPSTATPLSWIKKCTELFFKHSPENGAEVNCENNAARKISSTHEEREIVSGFEFPNLNLPENQYSKNDKKVILSQFNMDMSGISERARSKGKDRSERASSRRRSVFSATEQSKEILEVPLASENAESAHSLDLESNKNKKKVIHYKADNVLNMSGEKSRSNDSATNALPAGSKRHINYSSHDRVDALSQNHKKRRQHKNVTGTLIEEITSKCVVSTEIISPLDENNLVSFNRTPGYREKADGFLDENHEVPEATVKNKETDTVADNLQDVQSNGCADFPLAENGVSCPGSSCQGATKSREKLVEKVCFEADEEPAKELARPHAQSELVARSCRKLNGNDDDNENFGEEDEEQASVKEKLWNFLIT